MCRSAFGGPIKKDKLWFYAVGRDQGIRKLPVGVGLLAEPVGRQSRLQLSARSQPAARGVHEHVAQRATPASRGRRRRRTSSTSSGTNRTSVRTPARASSPVFTSPESWFSVADAAEPPPAGDRGRTRCRHKILLEAGISVTTQFYNTSHTASYTNPIGIPRISETGDTAGADSTAPRVNAFAGSSRSSRLTSGSLNNAPGGALRNARLGTTGARARPSPT